MLLEYPWHLFLCIFPPAGPVSVLCSVGIQPSRPTDGPELNEKSSWSPSPGDWHTYWFHWLEPHPLLCLVCKGRRGGLVQESHLISGRNTTSAYLMQLRSSCKGWRGRDKGRAPEVHTDAWSHGCHLISVSHR